VTSKVSVSIALAFLCSNFKKIRWIKTKPTEASVMQYRVGKNISLHQISELSVKCYHVFFKK
jgi:hypothetical protein